MISDIVHQVEELSPFHGGLVTAKLGVSKMFGFIGLDEFKFMLSILLSRGLIGSLGQLHSLLQGGADFSGGGFTHFSILITDFSAFALLEIGRPNGKVDAVVRLLLP